MITCQAIGCNRPAVYVAERKSDRARRVMCAEVSCVVAVLATHGVSNCFDLPIAQQ